MRGGCGLGRESKEDREEEEGGKTGLNTKGYRKGAYINGLCMRGRMRGEM